MLCCPCGPATRTLWPLAAECVGGVGTPPLFPPRLAVATGASLSPPRPDGAPPGSPPPPPTAAALRGRGTPPGAYARGAGQCHVPAHAPAHGPRVARGAEVRDPPHGGSATSNARPGRGLRARGGGRARSLYATPPSPPPPPRVLRDSGLGTRRQRRPPFFRLAPTAPPFLV